jgi:two-component system, OmpR family, sensor histidine kinase KdpD
MNNHAAKILRSFTTAAPGCIAVVLITYICFELHLQLTITSFLYLLVVLAQSMRGSFASSAFVSLLTVACLDFFFTPPVFSFEVTNPLDLLALISYLMTGLVITGLTTRARQAATVSNQRRRQLDSLYRLATQLLALNPNKSLLVESLERFREVFELRGICLFDAASGEIYAAGVSGRNLSERTRSSYLQAENKEEATGDVSIRCLRAAGRTLGVVAFEGLEEHELVTGPLAALATAMLERARAFHGASRAAASEQAETFRSAVLDALAHEFKTPLATILTAAGGLRETHLLHAHQQELAELIECETARLTGLTSQILRTSRLDQSEVKPHLERTNLTDVVTGLVDHYARQWLDRKFHIQKEGISAEVFADPELLELAVKELLDNACKYSLPGSEVEVSIQRDDDEASVRVMNCGSPIRDCERTRIFERYYRGSERSDMAGGSGLGLYFADQIVRAHGGSMELEDGPKVPDKATSFRLTLPLASCEC